MLLHSVSFLVSISAVIVLSQGAEFETRQCRCQTLDRRIPTDSYQLCPAEGRLTAAAEGRLGASAAGRCVVKYATPKYATPERAEHAARGHAFAHIWLS